MENVSKTTVYLADISEFAEMKKGYSQYFNEPYSARATLQVAALPKGVKVEIEVVAK